MLFDEHGRQEVYDARYLIATLLVQVAKGDGNISPVESDKMLDLLSSTLDSRGAEALESLSRAIMALANDRDIVARLQSIGKSLSGQEKDDVFTMVVEVAAADQDIDPGEIRAINLAGQILGMAQDEIHTRLRSLDAARDS